MNKFKITLTTIVVLFVVAVASLEVYAASLTGTTARVNADSSDWGYRYQDYSDYPTQNDRAGTIIRYYLFSADGGAVSTIVLDDKTGVVTTNIPDNTIIWDGFIDVITPVLPANTITNTLDLNSTGDILAANTNTLSTAGIKAIVPVGTAATAVKTTASRTLGLTLVGNAATQGMFMVYMKAYLGQ